MIINTQFYTKYRSNVQGGSSCSYLLYQVLFYGLKISNEKFADNSELGPRFRSADHDHAIIKTKPALKILTNRL